MPRATSPKGLLQLPRQNSKGNESALSQVAKVLESHEEELRGVFQDWQNDLNRIQREHVRLCGDLSRRLQAGLQKRTEPETQLTVPEAVPVPVVEAPQLVTSTAWAEPTSPTADSPKRPTPPAISTEVAKVPVQIKHGSSEKNPGSRFGDRITLLYGAERAKQNSVTRNSLDSRKSGRVPGRRPMLDVGALKYCVRSAGCRAVCSIVILANAIFMGLHAQERLQAILVSNGELPDAWEHAETGFAIFFIVELFLRVLGEGRGFLNTEEAPWNLFDAFLVLLSIVDNIMTRIAGSSTLNFTFARTLRIFRFARILRIVRVMRFFYSFRLMVYAVIYSIVSLLWVFVMLLFVMYFFAIFFLNGVGEYFKDGVRSTEDDFVQHLLKCFGTVPNALLSLFMGISGGIDWIELKEPLAEVNSIYGWVFLFYIFFMIFGVLNVVVASFVDSASQISRKDRELVTQNEMERQKQYAANIRRFFHEADVDGTGTLSWEEFEDYLHNPKVQAYFQSFELDVSQARTLFKLLDLDESNDVGIDEFVEGCMRMKGPARSIDVNMLLYESEKMIDRTVEFMAYVEDQFENMVTMASIKDSSTPKVTPLGRSRPRLRSFMGLRAASRHFTAGGGTSPSRHTSRNNTSEQRPGSSARQAGRPVQPLPHSSVRRWHSDMDWLEFEMDV